MITGGPEILITFGDTVGNLILSNSVATYGLGLNSSYASLGLTSGSIPFVLTSGGGVCMQLNSDKIVYTINDLVVNTSATGANGNISLIGLNTRVKTLESAGGSYPTYSDDAACATASVAKILVIGKCEVIIIFRFINIYIYRSL